MTNEQLNEEIARIQSNYVVIDGKMYDPIKYYYFFKFIFEDNSFIESNPEVFKNKNDAIEWLNKESKDLIDVLEYNFGKIKAISLMRYNSWTNKRTCILKNCL